MRHNIAGITYLQSTRLFLYFLLFESLTKHQNLFQRLLRKMQSVQHTHTHTHIIT